MPRPKSLKPSYCLHKSSGLAFVRLDGKTPRYVGKHGTQASRDEYDRVIGEWIASGRQTAAVPSPAGGPGLPSGKRSVAQLVHAFWKHAQTYYLDREGKPGPEADNYRQALRWLRKLYGETPAEEFGPLALKAIRATVIKPHAVPLNRVRVDAATGKRRKEVVEVERPGWSRTYSNRQMSRIKQVFKWGVENELVPAAVHQALMAVSGLRKGKTEARETKAVRPAPQEDVDKVLPLLPPPVRGMVDLEAITGMRPGEVRIMRGCDIETRAEGLWVYRPAHHKTEHHGDDHVREIFLGPKAIEVVRKHLKTNPLAHLFDPADADAWQREQRANAPRGDRTTPVYPCELRRREQERHRVRTKGSRRTFRDHYTKDSYNRAVRRACDKAELSAWWTPNRLRHAAATRIRATHGLEGSQVVLGHKHAKITEVYAESNRALAAKIAAEVG
ncbi:MAG TPA: site-specific integrase [Tepidisphaeraceae bacterium]|nr:site-specific integrase [Tepidisphaeraceae bacterium]